MHPSNTGVPDDQVPTLEQMSAYMYKHGSRFESKSELAHPHASQKNKDYELERLLVELTRENVDLNTKEAKESKKEKKFGFVPQNHRNMMQRPLGMFIRIEITEEGVSSNDENYMRWAVSYFTRFFQFLCLGSNGHPHNIEKGDVEMHMSREGFVLMQKNLKDIMSKDLKKYSVNGLKAPHPPEHDPMNVLPGRENL